MGIQGLDRNSVELRVVHVRWSVGKTLALRVGLRPVSGESRQSISLFYLRHGPTAWTTNCWLYLLGTQKKKNTLYIASTNLLGDRYTVSGASHRCTLSIFHLYATCSSEVVCLAVCPYTTGLAWEDTVPLLVFDDLGSVLCAPTECDASLSR